MRSSVPRWALAIALVAVAGCSGIQTPPAKPAVDEAAIRAAVDSLNTAWMGAVAARDTSLLASLYSAGAHVLPANGPRAIGKEAVRQAMAHLLSIPGLDVKTVSTSKIISENGDLVVDTGTYELSGTDAKGKPFRDVGKWVEVLQRENGEWKLVVDTWNSDLPVPGM